MMVAAQLMVPWNGTRWSSLWPPVVVNVRRDQIFRRRLDGFGRVAEQVRVADVHADAEVGALEAALENLDRDRARSKGCCPSPRARRSRRAASAMPWISSTLRMAASRWLSSGPGCWATGTPEMDDEELERDRLRDVQRGRDLVQRRLARIVVA